MLDNILANEIIVDVDVFTTLIPHPATIPFGPAEPIGP
jgi:hypothetical protein